MLTPPANLIPLACKITYPQLPELKCGHLWEDLILLTTLLTHLPAFTCLVSIFSPHASFDGAKIKSFMDFSTWAQVSKLGSENRVRVTFSGHSE